MTPGAAVYNVPLAARLLGPLDVAAFEQSLNAVVARHDVLRTTFAAGADGNPNQIVAPALSVPLPVIDLCTCQKQTPASKVQRLTVAESQRPFDLTAGPLVRAALLRLGEREHALLLTLHHIISDGWSLGVLLREVMEFYEAYATGEALALPALPIQYADYAVWQRQWLQGEVLAKQLDYWKQPSGRRDANAGPAHRPPPTGRSDLPRGAAPIQPPCRTRGSLAGPGEAEKTARCTWCCWQRSRRYCTVTADRTTSASARPSRAATALRRKG